MWQRQILIAQLYMKIGQKCRLFAAYHVFCPKLESECALMVLEVLKMCIGIEINSMPKLRKFTSSKMAIWRLQVLRPKLKS